MTVPLLTFAAPMEVIGDCGCVFLTSQFLFQVSSPVVFVLCLFGQLFTCNACRNRKKHHPTSPKGELKSESVALKALLKASMCTTYVFSGFFLLLTPGSKDCKCKVFHQWATGSITTVLHHLAIDSDLTDIYLDENLWDYIKIITSNF